MKAPETITDATLDPGTAAFDMAVPFQAKPLAIRGEAEAVLAVAATVPPVSRVEAPQTAETPKPAPTPTLEYKVAYAGATAAKARLRARVYDLLHGSNIHGLLVERQNEERDLAMARSLGLVGTTHCAKHERALKELRH